MKNGWIACVLLLTPPACWAQEKVGGKDLGQLEGRWIQGQLIFLEPATDVWNLIYGRVLSTEKPQELFTNRAGLVVEGNRFTFTNGDHATSGKFEIDPTKDPKEIDFLPDKGKKLLGLYEIKDGQLRFAFGDTRTRPEGIEIREGDKGRLQIGFSRRRP